MTGTRSLVPMHELSVCQALMAEVARVAREQRARQVVSVTVRIGPLSGVEPALLQSAFPLASVATVAANSLLVIERAPVRVQCLECGAQSQASSAALACSRCASGHVQLLSGDELLLIRVELQRDDGEREEPAQAPVGSCAYSDSPVGSAR